MKKFYKFLILLSDKVVSGLFLLVAAIAMTGALWVVSYIVGVGAEKLNIAPPDASKGTAETGVAFLFLAAAFAYLCVLIVGGVKWLINLWKEANE